MESEKFEDLAKLPPQKIGAFKAKRLSIEDEDAQAPMTGFKKRITLEDTDSLDGTGNSQDKIFLLEGELQKSTPFDEGGKDVLSRIGYMKNAFIEDLNENTIDSFFKNMGFVKIFGRITQLKMRFGLDHVNKVAKLFVKKDNFAQSKPSILNILWTDVEEITSFLSSVLDDIHKGLANKNPIMRPETLAGYIAPKPETMEFWNDPSCYYTESGCFRIRVIWNAGNVYSFYLNNVKEEKVYENEKGVKHYLGPKIRLVKTEVEQFLERVKEIKAMVPEHGNITSYINKIK